MPVYTPLYTPPADVHQLSSRPYVHLATPLDMPDVHI